jgi:hypothetical protein
VFDNVSQAIAAHDSPAYQAAVKVLGDGAERDVLARPYLGRTCTG